MNLPVILVEGVSKKYSLSRTTNTAKKEPVSLVQNIRKPPPSSGEQSFWALKDISFTLQEGDILGVIGKNGAGKSSLLNILSGITYPTTGRVEIRGNLATILEVGTGFHPDLSGRDNIFFSAISLGTKQDSIRNKFDEIVEFSGVKEFIDMPVKYYSSGMYLRLAASVAFHIDVDVFLFDEVLSVGDVEFKHRVLEKIKNITASGKTAILVTHNINDVLHFCNKCMLLENGTIASLDTPGRAIAKYLSSPFRSSSHAVEEVTTGQTNPSIEAIKTWDRADNAPCTEHISLRQICAHGKGKKPGDKILSSEDFVVEVQFWKLKPNSTVQVQFVFFDYLDNPVFATANFYNQGGENVHEVFRDETGLFRLCCTVPGNFLYKGTYSLQLRFGVNIHNEDLIYRDDFSFTLHPDPTTIDYITDAMPVAVRPILSWKHERLA